MNYEKRRKFIEENCKITPQKNNDIIVKKLVLKREEQKDGSIKESYDYEYDNVSKRLQEESNTIKIDNVEELLKKLEKENN